MPGTPVNLSDKTTVAFGTSAYEATTELMNFDWDGIEIPITPTTHLASTLPGANEFGGQTFIGGTLANPGIITLTYHFNPQAQVPLAQGVKETITITWPKVTGDTTSAIWVGSGIVKDFKISAPERGDKMTATVIVQLSGVVTMTDAA